MTPRPRSWPASTSAARPTPRGCRPRIAASSLRFTGRLSTKQTASTARARSSGSASATQPGTRGRPISSRSSSVSSPADGASDWSPASSQSSAVDGSGRWLSATEASAAGSSAIEAYPNRAERLRLVDHCLAALEQLEQGEEAGHGLQAAGHPAEERLEVQRSGGQRLQEPAGLLLDREGDHPHRQRRALLEPFEHLAECGHQAIRGDPQPLQREHVRCDQPEEAALARLSRLEQQGLHRRSEEAIFGKPPPRLEFDGRLLFRLEGLLGHPGSLEGEQPGEETERLGGVAEVPSQLGAGELAAHLGGDLGDRELTEVDVAALGGEHQFLEGAVEIPHLHREPPARGGPAAARRALAHAAPWYVDSEAALSPCRRPPRKLSRPSGVAPRPIPPRAARRPVPGRRRCPGRTSSGRSR